MWKEIEEFPGYFVSDEGRVRNYRGHVLTQLRNQRGLVYVGMVRDGAQFKRGLALLVAEYYLDPPSPKTFDTPIHLDGDQTNNRVENLMWRPRWFAVKYQRQFTLPKPIGFSNPIQDRSTGRIYKNSMEAAKMHGLLDQEIFTATLNRTYVWPTYQEFRVVDQ